MVTHKKGRKRKHKENKGVTDRERDVILQRKDREKIRYKEWKQGGNDREEDRARRTLRKTDRERES